MAATNTNLPLLNGHKTSAPAIEHDVASNLALVQSFLAANPDVRFFRHYVLDYAGVLHVRCTTSARALRLAAQPHAGVTGASPIISGALSSGGVLPEIFELGDDAWVPDWSSLRIFGASKKTAFVMCSAEELVREKEGLDSMLIMDPRARLMNVVAQAKSKHDIDVLVGYEIEFILLTSPDASESIPSPAGFWTPNALREAPWEAVVEESVTLLEAAGVHVWSFNTEHGDSKYEIALSPLPPLEATDALQFAHETIKSVAQKAGYYATMHAKPFETGPTAGKHVHFSLSRPELGTPFLAGVLNHFRALCGFMLSNIDSYQRASHFGGGTVCWGWNNKLTCVKRIQDAYFELRPPDSFANPYLMLAALIAVGIKGVEDNEEPVIKSFDELMFSTGRPSDEQKKKYNLICDMPKDLAESLAELKKDEVIKTALGEKCLDRYVYTKEKDLEACEKLSTVERRKILLRYF